MNNSVRNQYLSAMGIDVWVDRNNTECQNEEVTDVEQSDINSALNKESISQDVTLQNWNELENIVKQCRLCDALKARKNSLVGSGNKQADLFIIGSIPSHEEDSNAQEYTGLEGVLLDNMLSTLNLSRKEIYTTNLIKCSSQNHREFSSIEMKNCIEYLEKQISLVEPKVLIILGEQSAQFILKINNEMMTLVNKQHHYKNIPVVVIEHPEKLLLSVTAKKQTWQTLLKVKQCLL